MACPRAFGGGVIVAYWSTPRGVRGVICQESTYFAFSQPHMLSFAAIGRQRRPHSRIRFC